MIEEHKEFAERLLVEYTREMNVSEPKVNLSDFESWLISRLYKKTVDLINFKSDAFNGLITMHKNTAGATFQYYFNKKTGEHVIYLTSMCASFHHVELHKAINAAENYILAYRTRKTGNPTFTLFK